MPYSWDIVPGLIVGPPYISCEPGTNAIRVGPIASMVLRSNQYHQLHAEEEITYSPSGLAASTHYHLCAKDQSVPGFWNTELTVVHFDAASGPPHAGLVYKADEFGKTLPIIPMHRYLCSFRTDGAGNIYGFRKVGNLYLYDWSGEASNDFRVLSAGNATSFTDVSLAAFLPAHVRQVYLKAIFTPKFNQFGLGSLRTNGSTGGEHELTVYGASIDGAGPSALEKDIQNLWMLTDSGRVIEYKVSDADDYMILHILGYQE